MRSLSFQLINTYDFEISLKMGGQFAKDITDALDADDSHDYKQTPPTGRHRILSSDPRSPTTDVDRTPIVVEQTPRLKTLPTALDTEVPKDTDPRSPTENVPRTPIQTECSEDFSKGVLRQRPKYLHIDTSSTPTRQSASSEHSAAMLEGEDPRSPSKDISRTPITESASEIGSPSGQEQLMEDPRSPSCDIVRTPVFTDSTECLTVNRGEGESYHKLSESSCASDVTSNGDIDTEETVSLTSDDVTEMKLLQPKKLFPKNDVAATRETSNMPKYVLQRLHSEKVNRELESAAAAEDKENVS